MQFDQLKRRPGFSVVSWYGLFVPAQTPTEIIVKMNTDVIAELAAPTVQERLATLGYESRRRAPEQVEAFLKADAELWGPAIKEVGIAPQD
jgi:tripartite-type tricarboxylate transporter receptor subunit TctC